MVVVVVGVGVVVVVGVGVVVVVGVVGVVNSRPWSNRTKKKIFLQIHNFVKGYQMLPMTKWLQLWPKKASDLPPNFSTKKKQIKDKFGFEKNRFWVKKVLPKTAETVTKKILKFVAQRREWSRC